MTQYYAVKSADGVLTFASHKKKKIKCKDWIKSAHLSQPYIDAYEYEIITFSSIARYIAYANTNFKGY